MDKLKISDMIVIAQTVRKYLYMFEIEDIRYKQQIYQELGIEMFEIRKIEHLSKDKKGKDDWPMKATL